MGRTGTTVLIPCGTCGSTRLRSLGAKNLLDVSPGITVLDAQLNNIYSAIDNPKVVLVTAIEHNKIKEEYEHCCTVVKNHFVDTYGMGWAFRLGLMHLRGGSLIILYGDILCGGEVLVEMQRVGSSIAVDSKRRLHKRTVGINTSGDQVQLLSYGLPKKWAQIVYLTGNELLIFKDVVCDARSRNLMGHEILNKVIEEGGIFNAVEVQGQLAEIDTAAELRKVRKRAYFS